MSRLALPKSIEACLKPADLTRVELLSQALADAMRDIHGGEWRIQIGHEHEYAMVVSRSPRAAS